MQGGFNQEGDVTRTLLDGANFQAKGWFFAENLAPGAILFYQGGDIPRGAMLFCDTGTRRRDYEIHGRS